MQTLIGVLAVLGTCGAVIDLLMREDHLIASRLALNEWAEKFRDQSTTTLIHESQLRVSNFFNDFFGPRHFSWRCFSRSILVSIFGIAFVAVQCASIQGPEFFDVVRKGLIDEETNQFKISWLLAYLLTNIVADYISLIETRVVLRGALGKPLLIVLFLLTVDLLFSYSIYEFTAVPLYTLLTGGEILGPGELISDYWTQEYVSFWKIDILTPFLWSTFFTSVLFYVMVLWHLLIWSTSRFNETVASFLYGLSQLRNPFLILGVLGAIGSLLSAWLEGMS